MSKHKPKLFIVVVSDRFFLTHFLDRALHAQRSGYEVIVVAPDTGFAERIREHHFSFLSIDLDRHNINPLPELRTIVQLIKLYRKLAPDVAWQIGIKPIVLGTLAVRIGAPRTAIVNAPVGLGYVFAGADGKARTLRPLIKIALRRLLNPSRSRVIFENAEDLAELEQMGAVRREDSVVIPGAGVNLRQFRPRPQLDSASPVVLLAARLIEEKGVRVFADAAQHLKTRRPNVRFVLAGGVDIAHSAPIPESQLQQWVKDGIIEWLGDCHNMSEVLSACTLFCLPTWHREGLPKVLLEAMACERPVITTDVVGCRELIQHGRNGLLIPPKDAWALADAIETLLDDTDLRERLARQGYHDVRERYSSSVIARMTVRVFDALVRGKTIPDSMHAGAGAAVLPASAAQRSDQSGAPPLKVLCVIPSLNACADLQRLLHSLEEQDYPHDTLVVDSSSSDGTVQMLAQYPSVKKEFIARAEFGHGKTRQHSLATNPGYAVYVYLTQDAYFCGPAALRTLLTLLQNPRVGAACGRQIPHLNATPSAAFSRAFNYPPVAQIRCLADQVRFGIKTPFLSNSCTAYRATALAAVGGFPQDVVVSEDLYVGAKMLQAGWCLAQGATAIVYHSHNHTLRQDMQRYFLIGKFHGQQPWIAKAFGGTGGEGLRYFRCELRHLGLRRAYLWPAVIMRNIVKYVAFQVGKIS
ncbi:glycosyltransferase [Acidithiobacillus sp. IBUN Pt1247-S3]|uniref:glycosyltransferase n=1 Tax=Acidithiobacillus sp. IBUN Pt1247-S3 TaxID=3166642 RepID=UPI0034E3DD85